MGLIYGFISPAIKSIREEGTIQLNNDQAAFIGKTVHITKENDQSHKENLYQIIDINLKKLYSKADEIGYSIDLTDEAKDFIIDKGYNPKYGARPLERAIQKYIEDVLAEEILSGNVKKGDLVLADYDKKSKEIKITKLDTKKNKQKSK